MQPENIEAFTRVLEMGNKIINKDGLSIELDGDYSCILRVNDGQLNYGHNIKKAILDYVSITHAPIKCLSVLVPKHMLFSNEDKL